VDGGSIRLATPLREIALQLGPDAAPALRIAWHADRMLLGTRVGYFGVDGGGYHLGFRVQGLGFRVLSLVQSLYKSSTQLFYLLLPLKRPR
jgi:hypothetical protein